MNFNEYILSSGINPDLLFLILALPFVTLVVSFFRYFIGIKTFSIYEPIVLSVALFGISQDFLRGIAVGLPLIFVVWLVGELTNQMLARLRIHYISKVSLRISLASIMMLFVLFGLSYFKLNQYLNVSPIVLIIFITLIETISLFQYKKGASYANLIGLETIGVTLVSYLILSLNIFREFMLVNPYFVFVPLIFNLFVGRWNGLRLTEYIRFRGIGKNDKSS